MKIMLANSGQVMTYTAKYVLDQNIEYASYDSSRLKRCLTNEYLGELYRSDGHTYGISYCNRSLKVRSNISDRTLRNADTDEVLATFDGTPSGAVASYLTHMYLCSKVKNNTVSSIENNVKKSDTLPVSNSASENPKKEIALKQLVEAKKEPVLLQLPPTREEYVRQEIKREEYRPPDRKIEEFKHEENMRLDPPKIPIPSGRAGSEENSGGCLGIIIVLVVIFFAIKLIPQSWEDLSTYIPAGDSGITICFFSAVIGGIIALLISIIAKEPKFTSCMSAFFVTCIVGIVLNVIIVFTEGVEFTGFFLFDIPLSIFAPILGCFQFAFPIGIGVAIICGIICLAKKS